MYKNHITGKMGENIASNYLKSLKYKIIQKNFSCKFGEIDIIAENKDELIIVEVKTRTSNMYGNPADAITTYKRNNILKVAQYYLIKNNLEATFVRIDTIEILIDSNNNYKINHLKQII